MQPIVIRFGRLGDTVLLAPLLHRLHQCHASRCMLLGTGPWSKALYAGHPDVAVIAQVDARHRPLLLSPQRLRMLQLLRRERESPVYVCETEPRALRKIRRMIRLARIAESHCIFIPGQQRFVEEHWIDRLLRMAPCTGPILAVIRGTDIIGTMTAPQLHVTAADRIDRERWLSARGLVGRELILVQPANKRSMRWNAQRAASDDDKAWPLENWVEVLRAVIVSKPQARILLCGAPGEVPILQGIADAAQQPEVLVVADDLPLRRLMALAEIAVGMISVDSGPAHVAAALNCPLVVLFGAQSPRVWCPRSPGGSSVIALGGPPDRQRVDQIAPSEVIEAWRTLSAQRKRPASPDGTSE